MDSTRSNAIPKQRTGHNSTSSATALEPYVKDEDINIYDDEYDDGTYKPRPQLQKPFVTMRSLADLISK